MFLVLLGVSCTVFLLIKSRDRRWERLFKTLLDKRIFHIPFPCSAITAGKGKIFLSSSSPRDECAASNEVMHEFSYEGPRRLHQEDKERQEAKEIAHPFQSPKMRSCCLSRVFFIVGYISSCDSNRICPNKLLRLCITTNLLTQSRCNFVGCHCRVVSWLSTTKK